MDAGLVIVAGKLADELQTSGTLLTTDALAYELRQAGLPYVWPTVFTAIGGPNQTDTLRNQLIEWLSSQTIQGAQRCGIAIKRLADTTKDVLVAIVVDALADVAKVPRSTRANTPLELEFGLLVPASDVRLLALGPTGLPREVPVRFDPLTGNISTSVALPNSGRWLLQLIATLDASPRPVAEVEVWVDAPIPSSFESTEVPGESVANTDTSAPLALTAMLNAARQSEGIKALQVDAKLSELAEAHAIVMREQQLVSHDAGDGDPSLRLRTYQLPDGTRSGPIGENVARATSLRGAHRALWQSPAHRQTLLYKEFTHVGVGVATGLGGEVWVCELFVGPGKSTNPTSK